VYEQDTGNLFVHHDIPLPSFPLCLAHGDISPTGTAGNYCAVGTFGTGIEIWNLDVLNALEPSCVLGGEDTSMADEIMRHNMAKVGRQQRRQGTGGGEGFSISRRGGPSLKPGSHTDAVMSLSWNKVHRQVIASGSADSTVKLWDVTQAHNPAQAIAGTLTHHKDKVQSVVWHPVEGTLLATGSYDRSACLIDARHPKANVKRVKLTADCEALVWDPHNPQYLTAATEDGTLTCFDVRNFSDKKPLWSIVASEYGGVSDLSYNPYVPGLLATCSVDQTVTLWDTYNATTGTPTGPPTSRMNKDMRVGKLYTVNFYPSSPWLLGCAGGAKEMALWDMTREDVVQKCFAKRLLDVTSTDKVSSPPTTDTDDKTKSTVNPIEGDSASKKEEFDAMMAASSESNLDGAYTNPDNSKSVSSASKKKKDHGKKKKKKVHRAGR
jgi:periodic tryptophan protein 1